MKKKIAADFADRIIADHNRDFNTQSSNGLRHLDVNSLTYRTLGSLPDGLIAIVVSFVVEFSFALYGKFVDMGVGKGVRLEDVKSRDNRRRPKKWYTIACPTGSIY